MDLLSDKLSPGAVFVDVKSVMDVNALEARGFNVWRL